MTEDDLRDDIARWFESRDATAIERAFGFLLGELRLPATFVAMFQPADLEDVKVEVVEELLRCERGGFRDAPLAYARSTLRNRAVDRLRRQGRHAAPRLEADLDMRAAEPAAVPDLEGARRALAIAATLPLKGRLAILLTTAPDRISALDWEEVVNAHPPPPPARPTSACDPDAASRLLYPPRPDETRTQREQRLDTFSKARRRAIKEIRERWGAGPR